MSYNTFQEQFELLDDVPCMAATFNYLLRGDEVGVSRFLFQRPYIGNALDCGFWWFQTDEGEIYWKNQSALLNKQINNK